MRKSKMSTGEKSMIKGIDAGVWIAIVIAALVIAMH